MPNPYHDELGRFCSRTEMQTAITRLAISGNTKAYLELKQDYDEAEKETITPTGNLMDTVENFITSKLNFFNKPATQDVSEKEAKVALKYYPQAVNNMSVRNMGGTPLNVTVSEEEQAAIHHYVAGYDFNHDVYGGNKAEDLQGDRLNHDLVLNHSRNLLNQIFTRIPENKTETVKSFRGMRASDWHGHSFKNDFVSQLTPGNTMTFNGYTSTSPNPNEANYFLDDNGVLLEMEGYGGLQLDAESPEVLYRRNTRWEVVKVEKQPNGLTKATLKMV